MKRLCPERDCLESIAERRKNDLARGYKGLSPLNADSFGAVSKFGFVAAPFGCARMCKVQGTKTEVERSELTSTRLKPNVAQRSNLRMMTLRHNRPYAVSLSYTIIQGNKQTNLALTPA